MLGAAAQNILLPVGHGMAFASGRSRSFPWSAQNSFLRKGRLITSKRSRRPQGPSWKHSVPCATFTVSRETRQSSPPEDMPKTTPETLDWGKQWYPVHSTQDLDPARPHAIKLLATPKAPCSGKDLVLWNSNGEWKSFVDLCPHSVRKESGECKHTRMVPLSEGRVIEGRLHCAYHGWEFNGSGKPVSIPQIGHSDKKAEQHAMQSAKSCCRSFPTQVQQGLIWVWADDSPQAHIESAMHPPTVCPEYGRFENEDWAWTFEQYIRDVPGSFEFWMENMMDQSHVPFSHSGVVANRNFKEDAELFQAVGVDKRNKPHEGFEFHYKVNFNSGFGLSAQNVEFKPPCLCRFTLETSPTSGFALWIYAVPTSSNSTRLIISAGLSPKGFAQGKAKPKSQNPIQFLKSAGLRLFTSLQPRWKKHMSLSGVTDGDIVFLHRQSSFAKEQAGGRPMINYFLPSSSDRGVSAWYQWLLNRGGGGPQYAGDVEPQLFRNGMGVLDRRALLDRRLHVQSCSSCSQALKRVQLLQEAARYGSVASALGTAYFLGHGSDFVTAPVVGTLVLSAAMLVAEKKLKELEIHFGFLDWQHSEH